LLFVALSP